MRERRSFGTKDQLPSGQYRIRYTLRGERVAEVFPTEREADRALARIQTEMTRGSHVPARAGRKSLDAMATDYFATKTDWRSTTREDRLGLWRRHIGPTFGKMAVADITPSAIKSWFAGMHRKHPATAAGSYRLLRQLLNAAVADGLIVVNPCQIKGAGVDRSPERQIATVAEVDVITAEMPGRMRLLVLFAMWTGLRRSELLGLRRRDVDPIHRTLTVARTVHHLRSGEGMVVQDPKSKASGRSVHYPSMLDAEVRHHLAAFVAPGRDALVFTGEQGGPLLPHVFGKAFRRARAIAGREDLTLHDLRHTADTLAAATGATLPELMARMGHSTPHSAMRYLHASKDRDRVIAEALVPMRPTAAVIALPKR